MEGNRCRCRTTAGPISRQSPIAEPAQAYPSKIVKVVIPWPGGSNDAAGRIVFQKVAESIGQPVVIENRAGASGTIGAAYVAKSAPDGYTVMVTSASHIANAHLYKNLPFDALNDFIGITPLTVQTGILIVHPSLPVKTVKDLIALAKAKPNQILYGFVGQRQLSASHDGAFQCDDRHENDACAVQGRRCSGRRRRGRRIAGDGGEHADRAPAYGGQPHRVIAVCSESRMKQLPDIPTIAESGVPGYEFTAWVAAFVPAGTPKPIVERLSAEIKKALDQPDVVTRYDAVAFETLFMTPEQFAVRLSRIPINTRS